MKSIHLLLPALLLWQCSSDKEDVTTDINKDGSVEVLVSTTNTPDYTLLTTTHKVWVKGVLAKTVSRTDTIPALEVETKDETGNAIAPKQRDYEFFITVK